MTTMPNQSRGKPTLRLNCGFPKPATRWFPQRELFAARIISALPHPAPLPPTAWAGEGENIGITVAPGGVGLAAFLTAKTPRTPRGNIDFLTTKYTKYTK